MPLWRVHGRYVRRLGDAPVAGSPVVIELAVRRFKCLSSRCPAVLQGDQLPDWMERVLADDLPTLYSLVSGLRRDFDAVTAGLSTPWGSGQVEGHVTRVKLLKRMTYGRANLDLLRQRFLGL